MGTLPNRTAPIGTARGLRGTWQIYKLTPAQSKAYKRPREQAPAFEAVSPQGSIIRRATLTAAIVAVERSTAP